MNYDHNHFKPSIMKIVSCVHMFIFKYTCFTRINFTLEFYHGYLFLFKISFFEAGEYRIFRLPLRLCANYVAARCSSVFIKPLLCYSCRMWKEATRLCQSHSNDPKRKLFLSLSLSRQRSLFAFLLRVGRLIIREEFRSIFMRFGMNIIPS